MFFDIKAKDPVVCPSIEEKVLNLWWLREVVFPPGTDQMIATFQLGGRDSNGKWDMGVKEVVLDVSKLLEGARSGECIEEFVRMIARMGKADGLL